MLTSFPMCLIAGSILGFLAGLGIGGGSLLILWLTIVQTIPYSAARQINLLFFLPAAAITCLFRRRQGVLCLKKVLPAMLCGTAAAAAVCWITAGMDTEILKKAFGVLLILTGLRELRYKPKKEEP